MLNQKKKLHNFIDRLVAEDYKTTKKALKDIVFEKVAYKVAKKVEDITKNG